MKHNKVNDKIKWQDIPSTIGWILLIAIAFILISAINIYVKVRNYIKKRWKK